ncbi:RHS repeat-associated core domain-containing protein [Caballeronia sp. LZ035]|nr:RHS repeat-associated core domain-containing protein [Caballeronia sp. LZ035]MDR5760000.1 RHS repeat-associated core domain-containing protein [Caballeronia sp. LZ035]
MHYNRNRYFDPQTGIFISQDPIGLDGGLNSYRSHPIFLDGLNPSGCRTAVRANKFQGQEIQRMLNRSSRKEANLITRSRMTRFRQEIILISVYLLKK